MKDKQITIKVPDFCPEDCPEFKLCVDVTGLYATDDALVERLTSYSCKREDDCMRLYEIIETRYCENCRDAMKARGEI